MRRVVVIAAALLACATLAAACTADASRVARRATALRPAREIPPVQRLGRWDGATFTPLPLASVTGGHLYVLVHGWEEGYRDAVRRVPGPVPLLLWDPRAVNAHGVRAGTSFEQLAAAIAAADPGATVLAYSWLDDAATGTAPLDARRAAVRTDLNGQRLAVAVREVEAPSFAARGGAVHLIGHSFGAKVATVAAIALRPAPAQLTLLDSPENLVPELGGVANHLEGYLPLLPVGRGPGRTFVDSFFSLFGARYGDYPGLADVSDVRLLPAQYPVAALADRHAYPILWYETSARHLAAGVGLGWSPLLGADDTAAPRYAEQDWLRDEHAVPSHELSLTTRKAAPASRALRPSEVKVVPVHPPDAAATGGVVLATSGRRLWQVEVATAPGDLALTLDYRFLEPGDGAELAVFVDGTERLASIGGLAGVTGQHVVLDTSALASGRHTITAVLAPRGPMPARVTLGGLRLESLVGSAPRRSLSRVARLGLLGAVAMLFVAAAIALVTAASKARRATP